MSVHVVRDERVSVEQSEKVVLRDCKDVVLIGCIVSKVELCMFENGQPLKAAAKTPIEP